MSLGREGLSYVPVRTQTAAVRVVVSDADELKGSRVKNDRDMARFYDERSSRSSRFVGEIREPSGRESRAGQHFVSIISRRSEHDLIISSSLHYCGRAREFLYIE